MATAVSEPHAQYESAQSKGTLDKKERTYLALDTALNAIKTAGCPMNDPEVTKIQRPSSN